MHESVLGYVASVVGTCRLAERSVLEIGSANVNGSVRPLFTGAYVGIDHAEGPGVDKIADAENLPFADNSFEVVVSTEAAEHIARPWLAISEMARVCQPGGWVIVTCRGFDERGAFPLHNEPDHWRLGPGALEMMAEDVGLTDIFVQPDWQVPGWFMAARKP